MCTAFIDFSFCFLFFFVFLSNFSCVMKRHENRWPTVNYRVPSTQNFSLRSRPVARADWWPSKWKPSKLSKVTIFHHTTVRTWLFASGTISARGPRLFASRHSDHAGLLEGLFLQHCCSLRTVWAIDKVERMHSLHPFFFAPKSTAIRNQCPRIAFVRLRHSSSMNGRVVNILL